MHTMCAPDILEHFLFYFIEFSEINDPEELEQKCLELCECLAKDLAKHNLKVDTHQNFTHECLLCISRRVIRSH